MKVFSLGLLLGCCSLWIFSEVLSGLELLLIALAIALLAIVRVKNEVYKRVRWWLMGVLLGALYAHWTVVDQLSHRLTFSNTQVSQQLTGIICSIPEETDKKTSFLFCPLDEKSQLRKVKVAWYFNSLRFRPGETWRLSLKLKTPYSTLNEGTFDVERWSLVNSIDALGYVVDGERINHSIIHNNLDSFRYPLVSHYMNSLPETSLKSWHYALVTGEKNKLTPEDFSVLRNTGTSHLIAISGLHIGLVFIWVYWLVKWVWSRSVFCINRVPAQKVALVVASLMALLFALFSGFDLPAQRAMVAIVLYTVAQFSLVRWSPFVLLGWVIAILLAINPLAVLSEGFWLSVSAIGIIYWFALSSNVKGWRHWVLLQFVLSFCMSVIAALLFGQFSLTSVVANWLAIPLMSFVILPLDLIGFVLSFISQTLFHSVHFLANFALTILVSWLDLLNNSLPALPMSYPLTLVLVFVTIALVLGWIIPLSQFRWLISFNAVLMATSLFFNDNDDNFNLYFLDVGQGLSSIINYQDFWAAYDLGYGDNEWSASESIVLPFLYSQGVDYLDVLLISHNDADHTGNYKHFLANMSVGRLVSGERLQVKSELCKSDRVNYKELQMHWFQAANDDEDVLSKNDSSCLLQVSIYGQKVLLSGDIEQKAERMLLQAQSIEKNIDILSVPHHGSKTSSSWSFLAQTNPKIAVVSSGYLNRFKHPKPEVLKRYEVSGSQVFNTWKTGLIHFSIHPNGTIQQQVYRLTNKHLWNHRYSE